MPRTVLIVEDAETCSATLEIAFLRLENIATRLTTAREALRILADRDQSVCAIVTDLHMPGMDGFEFIEQVRAAARTAELPIIVVSGDSDPGTPDRVRRLGANAYFAKPYSPSAVRQALEGLIHVP